MTDTYADQLVLELRRRDVPGTRIGQVVAEVEAHVAESGEEPVEAFGAAEEYADRVAAALDRPAGTGGRRVLAAWPVALAAVLFADGAAGLAFGQQVRLTVGTLVLVGLLPPAAMVLAQAIGRRSRPAGLGAALLVVGAFLAPWLLAEPALATCPAWAVLAAGAVLATATVPWLVRANRVVDPRNGQDRYAPSRRFVVIMATVIALPVVIVLGAILLRHAG